MRFSYTKETMAEPVAPSVSTPAANVTPVAAVSAAPVSAPAVVPAQSSPVIPAVAAPIEYKFDKVDGIPESLVATVTARAKDLGLSEESAKKLHAAEVKSFNDDVESMKREAAQQINDWQAKNKSHPVYGLAKYEETQGRIKQALAALGDEGKALAEFFDSENVMHVPMIHNALAKIGYMLGDGKFIAGGAASQPAQSLEDRLYPPVK